MRRTWLLFATILLLPWSAIANADTCSDNCDIDHQNCIAANCPDQDTCEPCESQYSSCIDFCASQEPEYIEEEGQAEAPYCPEGTSCYYDWGDCKTHCAAGKIVRGVPYVYDRCYWGPSFYFFRPYVCVYRRFR